MAQQQPNGPEYPSYPSYPQGQGQGQGPQGYQPGYPPPYYGPAPRTTNGLAIASMVLGILWVYWIGSILALIFGYIARKQIRERNQSGNGMAVAGIVLGWIGVGTLLLVIVVAIATSSGGSSGGSY